ncbi:unnamed protein product [Adineta ricciae]|uniref:Uncharacterized protein n=1 Tax=Adineta ricciae TaxID=249248 RepID=A0A816G2K5_ADIRI|nr:unnamed protein product [Adineta ricciae]
MASTQQQRIILVTGANRGLGFEVVKKLVNQSTSNKDLILLGTRDLKRGQDAINQLGSPSNVHAFQLDTSSSDSIAQAANVIKQKYGGKLDILINNAGIVSMEQTLDAAREVFATNYYGVKLINQQLSPLIRENGRIVNVASEVGAWTLYDASVDLQNKYTSSSLTEEQLDALVKDFFSAVETNRLEEIGYRSKLPFQAYGVSKAALIALTRIEARSWSGAKGVLVVAVCPGYCDTDMNKGRQGARPAAIGADSILHAALSPANELENGAFYQDGKKQAQVFPCPMDLSKMSQQ